MRWELGGARKPSNNNIGFDPEQKRKERKEGWLEAA